MSKTLSCVLLVWAAGIFYPILCAAQSFSPAAIHRYEAEARQVEIIRDQWGIPHIYGKTDAAAVFGLMYAECQTDFSRVEKNYLEMLGRQAEAYGESYLYTDLLMRLIYDSAQAVEDYQASPPWMHQLLDAFADGINYYLYKHPATRPLVIHQWQPWYALLFTDGSVSATSTGGLGPDELKKFYMHYGMEGGEAAPGTAANGVAMEMTGAGDAMWTDGGNAAGLDSRDAVLAGDVGAGSNGLAIAPARTANGAALLYINPHVPYYFRMEVQVVSEEGLNAYGAVTWGQFFIYQGFNAHCGWMHTSSYADVADLYQEHVTTEGGGWSYWFEGQRRPLRTRAIDLWYKKAGGMSVVPVTGYYTGHGPVVAERDDRWLSLKEYNRSLPALEEAWLITKANTFAAYKQAMDIRANTTNNTVYADDQGNIAYWHGNFVPRRDSSYDWRLPVDGTIAATEWKGVHALDELVHVYDPASGWIQNCNATPFTVSGSSSPDPRNYPAYMAPEGENFRGIHAAALLRGRDHLTLDSLIAVGYDTYLAAFDLLIPALMEAYDSEGMPAALKEPIAILRSWDRRSAAASVATTLAIEWAARMAQYAPKMTIPEDATRGVDNLRAEIQGSSPAQRLAALSAVIADLEQRFGSWRMPWGDVCRYQRLTGKITETYTDLSPSLPVGLVPSALGELPSVQSRVMPGTKKRYAYSGNSFVCAVEFGKRVRAKSIVTGGESSDPASPHFSDQAKGFFEGKLKDVLFYREEVVKHMEKRYRPGME